MKLLIEIPEKTYQKIIAGTYDYGDMNVIIQNGTPYEERPHGKWDRGFCSVCGMRSLRTTQTGEIFGIEHTAFCKNCGADMRTEDGKIYETMRGW